MDPNTDLHYPIAVYDDAPPPAQPRMVTLCPGGRALAAPRFAISVADLSCRRCRQLVDVIGLSAGD